MAKNPYGPITWGQGYASKPTPPPAADPQSTLKRAHAAINRGAHGEAEPLLRKLVTEHREAPTLADALVLLGRLLQASQRVDEALALFEAEAADQTHTDPHLRAGILTGLCSALTTLGRRDDVLARCRAFLRDDPDSGHALLWLAVAGGLVPDSDEAQRVETLLEAGNLPPPTFCGLGFAYADSLDRAGRYDAAFAQYARANSVYKPFLAEHKHVFNADARDSQIDAVIDAGAVPRVSPAAKSPMIFIVGLPRSGTSLLEQILAAHPAVHGAVKSTAMPRIAGKLRRGGLPYPAGLERLAAAQADTLARGYLGSVASDAASGFTRITDKLPENVLHLNLIARLLPGARVLHCRRDPRDIDLSCFFQMFQDPHPWAYDLNHVGRYVRAHERLAEFWRQNPPLALREVDYADLVSDPEEQVRCVLAFCGLPWDPACLEFHRSARPVVTASALQVREPMHTRSVGRWKHYERHIGPLLEALA